MRLKHYAVQIAKAHGASWVAGVSSSKNAAFVRGLGADQVIDYPAIARIKPEVLHGYEARDIGSAECRD